MLNADSSTLKSDSELQASVTAPMMPERPPVPLYGVDRAHDLVDRARRKQRLQLRHEVARLVRPPADREQRERDEHQRQEGEQREVGDHRRQVGAAVGEELPEETRERLQHEPQYAALLASAPVDAAEAIAELLELSSQIEAAVALRPGRASSIASSFADEDRRQRRWRDARSTSSPRPAGSRRHGPRA